VSTEAEILEVRCVATREEWLTLILVITRHLMHTPGDRYLLNPIIEAVITALRMRHEGPQT
jgi:hypothetical protein